jgi:signal peptidase I
MLPSLDVGDEVLVSKVAYGWRPSVGLADPAVSGPRRGELVVFNFVDADGTQKLVLKRVIGVSGDRIRMQGNVPVINGWSVPFCDVGPYANIVERQFVMGRIVVEFLEDESYLTLHTLATREPFSGEYVVGSRESFVLGDHRSESIDSRAWNGGNGGGVPTGAIVGKVERFLVGTTRAGELDYARFLRRMRPELAIEGVDTTALSVAIRRCLANRPRDRFPPAVSPAAVARR